MAGFELPPDKLRAHADQLDAHAGELGTAADAANQVRLGADAYGQICAFLPASLSAAGGAVAETVRTAAGAVESLSTALRDAVADHEAQDAEIADALARLSKELGG